MDKEQLTETDLEIPWTERTIQRKRERFLECLSKGMSVTGAQRQAGIQRRQTLYEWRDRDLEFRAQWDAAIEQGSDILEDEAWRRAVDGVTEPVVSAGRMVLDQRGVPLTVQRYSDNILALLLKGRKPQKFRERVETTHVGDNSALTNADMASARDLVVGLLAGIAVRLTAPPSSSPLIEGEVAKDDLCVAPSVPDTLEPK